MNLFLQINIQQKYSIPSPERGKYQRVLQRRFSDNANSDFGFHSGQSRAFEIRTRT